MITDKDIKTRKHCAENSNNLKDEQIEEGLISPILEVRKSFAENDDVFNSLSEYQLERGLTDKSPLIRYIFAYKNICYYKKWDMEKLLLQNS